MTEYKAVCRIDSNDYITASGLVETVTLRGFEDGEQVTYVSLPPRAARTFARGILALADGIDGGEAKPASSASIKVGDRVRVVDADGNSTFVGKVGTVKTLHGASSYLPYKVEFGDGKGGHGAANGQWNCRAVERVADPLPEPLKVGDRVVIVKDDSKLRTGEYVGQTGTVFAVGNFVRSELVARVRLANGTIWWCEEVRRVDDAPTVTTTPAPLKVGDKLRVTRDGIGGYDVYAGAVLTVTDPNGERGIDTVDSEGAGRFFFTYRIGDGLERVDEEPATEPATVADPARLALLKEAQRLIDDGLQDGSPLAVARFLAGE